MVLIAFSLWLGAAALACGPFFIGRSAPEPDQSMSNPPPADVPVARNRTMPVVATDMNAPHGDGSQIAYTESAKGNN
jgi:hypothetical protein